MSELNKYHCGYVALIGKPNVGKSTILNNILKKNYLMMKYQKLNIVLGWAAFAVAAIVYILTIEPTASFWDCGEFIATGFKFVLPS